MGQRQSLRVVNLHHDIVPAQSFHPTHLNSQVRTFGPSEALHKELRMALAKHVPNEAQVAQERAWQNQPPRARRPF